MKNSEPSDPTDIQDSVVESYFSGKNQIDAATMSMMAHEHDLPQSALRHRLNLELQTISSWLIQVDPSASVLDCGCGAGAWVEAFAKKFGAVVGIERSHHMVNAARKRTAHLTNTEIIQGDSRKDLPKEKFDLVFLGGLCMYMNDEDVLDLLSTLKTRLGRQGMIILRESTVRTGKQIAQGEYQAVYRSVEEYRRLITEAGFGPPEVRRNRAYDRMLLAEELVDLRREVLPFLPERSKKLGAFTWYALLALTPFSFWLMPRLIESLRIPWPKLQNHFFRLV